MQDIILQGSLIDLKEAGEEKIVWQTTSLRDQIEEVGVRSKGLSLPLDGDDVTKESIPLVKEFLPDIRLSGLELRSERMGKSWAGSFFRVIAENKNPDHRCIQHVHVWTKQRFFISLWVTVFPLFILGIMGTLIYSYLSFQTAILSIILLGGIFFCLGAYQLLKSLKGLARGAFNFRNQHLFTIFGLVMWSLLIEMFLTKPTGDVVEGAETWHPTIPGEDLIKPFVTLEYQLRFSYVAAIFIIAGFIALFFWWRAPPSFTHATHDMDYAPFFVYIRKVDEKWGIEKVRYDTFHYYAGTKSIDELRRMKAISRDQKRAKFTIPNFWHSFEPKVTRAPWAVVGFGLLLFFLGILLGLISFSSRIAENPIIAATTIRFVFVPLLLFFGAYLAFSRWPTPIMDKDIDFSDRKYHLTAKKLNIFWNLRGDEPAFKVRSKLQDPFMDGEHFSSFRDDYEHILLYNVLPKLRELEQMSQESFFQKL